MYKTRPNKNDWLDKRVRRSVDHLSATHTDCDWFFKQMLSDNCQRGALRVLRVRQRAQYQQESAAR